MPDTIQALDEQALRWLLGHRTEFLSRCFRDLTALGSTAVLALLALFALGLLLLEGRYRKAALLALVLVGAYFAVDALKTFFARPRPVPGAEAIPMPGSPSFPSGHTLLATTAYLAAALCVRGQTPGSGRRRAGPYVMAWAVLLSLLVGVSRLYLGVHYPSDMLGGWLLGLGFAAAFWAADCLTGCGIGQGQPPPAQPHLQGHHRLPLT
jgi:undecaprenyl-diphosphatase